MEKIKRALFIGGHLSPALAVIEELKTRPGWEVFWVGRKFAMEGQSILSLEYEIVPKKGIEFFDLKTGRFQRRWSGETISSLLRVIPGFFNALKIVLKIKPHIVVSFGGYLSVPVVFVSWILRIPIIVHEQTTTSGLANRFASFFAKKIAISFQESASDFNRNKIVLTGNPVNRLILSTKNKPTKPPMLYVTGGGQGSRVINQAIGELLPELTKRFSIIHQTGPLDYQEFRDLEDKFKNYKVYSMINREEVARVFEKASFVISRGGANTISEIAIIGIPCILIPIPWSEHNEQEKNSRALEATGLAIVINQKDLSKKILLKTINTTFENLPTGGVREAARLLVNPNASYLIADLIEKYALV